MTWTAPAPAPPPVIRFEKVSKRFMLRAPAHQRVRETLLGKRQAHEHWALRDVDLSIASGETVAVIGANGAGKSTLLALVAAATGPSEGVVQVSGRVAALLELGAGFHPDWTGRQNAEFLIRLRGPGRKEARQMVEEVEAFADIGVHFDQPLRTCSSGMALRVAFAAAVCIDPEILIVDEALAVGDADFQHKCFRKLAEFKERGVTILLVTHRLEIVPQLCSRAVFLDRGRIMFDGTPGEALSRYARSKFAAPALFNDAGEGREEDAFGGYRFGEGGAVIEAVRTASASRVIESRTGETARFEIDLRFDVDVERPVFGFSIKSLEDIALYVVNSEVTEAPLRAARRGERRTIRVEVPLRLAAGTFFAGFSICALEEGLVRVLDGLTSHVRLDISGRAGFGGIVNLEASIREDAAG